MRFGQRDPIGTQKWVSRNLNTRNPLKALVMMLPLLLAVHVNANCIIWYWQNMNEEPVTITAEVSGFYQDIRQIK